MKLVDKLRAKREELLKAKELQERVYQKNSVYLFYEQSNRLANANKGHVYLITPDEVLEDETPSKISHKTVCKKLLSEKYHEEVDFSGYPDFGTAIPEKYNTLFIRMVSILNNVSMLYYPKKINEFQLRELKKFKEQLDDYNSLHKDLEQAVIIYKDENGNESRDLDALIRHLEEGLKKKNSVL